MIIMKSMDHLLMISTYWSPDNNPVSIDSQTTIKKKSYQKSPKASWHNTAIFNFRSNFLKCCFWTTQREKGLYLEKLLLFFKWEIFIQFSIHYFFLPVGFCILNMITNKLKLSCKSSCRCQVFCKLISNLKYRIEIKSLRY